LEIEHDLEALGVDLLVLDQNIDRTISAGRLLFHVRASIAEFERDLIREWVIAGVRRARALGRPPADDGCTRLTFHGRSRFERLDSRIGPP